MGFPGSLDGKESACNAGEPGSIPGSGRSPGEGHGNPFRYSCLGEFHGQRSPVGYSPRGHKERDMTEQLTYATNNNGKVCVCVCVRMHTHVSITLLYARNSYNIVNQIYFYF